MTRADPISVGGLHITPAVRGDASEIAVLTDIAGHGFPGHFWGGAADRLPGTSLIEIGRRRARRDTGNFSWRNARMARIGGDVAGMVLGYRQPDDLSADDLAEAPAPVQPLIELEAKAPGSWYLNALAVHEEHRGRGLGGSLVDHAVAAATAEGAPEISLIVEDVNRAARRLYERHGFRETSTRPYVPIPMGPAANNWVLMVRDLH